MVCRNTRAGSTGIRLLFLSVLAVILGCFAGGRAWADGSIVISPDSATLNTITVTWTNGGSNYDGYNVRLNGVNQHSTSNLYYTFQGPGYEVVPGATYTVAVEGCSPIIVLGSGPSGCSHWATLKVTTPAPPPGNLSATAGASSVALTWTNPAAGLVPQPTQTVSKAPCSGNNNCSVSGVNDSFTDNAVAPSTSYKYSVCVNYASGQACSTVSTTTLPAPPQCQVTESYCPAGGGNQIYNVTCPSTVDFWLGQSIQHTGTSFSGTEVSNFISTTIKACDPGTTSCSFYTTQATETCPLYPTPKPVPPLKNCEACYSTGRKCEAAGGGFKCVGLAQ
jgi:hypothetical protein